MLVYPPKHPIVSLFSPSLCLITRQKSVVKNKQNGGLQKKMQPEFNSSTIRLSLLIELSASSRYSEFLFSFFNDFDFFVRL